MKKYQQVAASIQHQIALGAWLPGDKLPSLREQAALTGTSLITVTHAYQQLERQGVIQVRPQSGYYVSPTLAPPVSDGPGPQAGSDSPADIQGISQAVFDVLQSSCRPGMVAFGSAFPDPGLFPHRQLNQVLTRVSSSATAYSVADYLPPGSLPLRRAIARRYAQQGIAVDAAEIVITAGALEALNLSLSAVTAPGDYVIVETPCFYGALQAIQRLRLKPVTIPSTAGEGIDMAALETALSRWPVKACWLMTTHQNPTGYSLSPEKKQHLVALLARHQVVLIEDDVYGELYDGVAKPLPAKTWDNAGQVLHCASFSKCLVAGFRIGWVAAGKYARSIQQMQFMSTLSASSPMQLAVAEYLATQRYDAHLKRLRHTLHQRKQYARALLAATLPEAVTIHCHPGGYFLWLELPPGIDSQRLSERALADNISIAPGHLFTFQGLC
ncbi:PLP-dependent aminotransferase family protein [Shimwellia pseudoproteus]|uniref:aminotransferase-like domain-containing protein n=1 Tax=Shimwellia pseudoproteus TaxID=570012 RepID=UPI0018ECF5DD|nr:PLP-dependent aminotransferase family protein [Shimwellia pseudoproteus]MBJ3816865.1 PLP-dependent aminotransferase family protein [Shimwellia pseudoproteus]